MFLKNKLAVIRVLALCCLTRLVFLSSCSSENLSHVYTSKNMKIYVHKTGHCSSLYNSKGVETLKCPSLGDWLTRMHHTTEDSIALKRNVVSL